jgi:dTDP-4-dehydrorhamnose 3,5-epimerase
MNIVKSKLDGVLLIEPDIFKDERGDFVKVFHKDMYASHGINTDFKESYYSTSKKDVIRGMHFQTPPHDHAKLVHVTFGSIKDVVLDLRKNSPTYGQFDVFEINADNKKMVYIPSGFAHGFVSLIDNSQVAYLQSTMRVADAEGGIIYNSFGMDWGVSNPILSQRDQTFPTLANFNTPFL